MKKIISYIGSKEKLLEYLEENIFQKYNKENKKITFFDLFAGTSVVSNYINKTTNWNIQSNDFSQYSYILFYLIYFQELTENELKEIISKLEYLDNLKLIENGFIFNELSAKGKCKTIENLEKVFDNQPYKSRMFFSEKVGKKIDTIKNQIKLWEKNNKLKNNKIKNILLLFLINYADKNSNTTSVYGAYLKTTKKLEKEIPFLNQNLLNQLKIGKKQNKKDITNLPIIEALELYKKSKDYENKELNIIYLDPPYSTRTYENNYHILNYIVDMNISEKDIKINSKTAQRKIKTFKNPFASKKETLIIFKEMINKSIDISNNIYISYNTDGLLKEKDIKNIIEEIEREKVIEIDLKTFHKEYKRFKSANNETKKIKEKINKLKHQKNKEEEILELENKIKNTVVKKEKTSLQEIIWYLNIKEKKC